MCLSNKQLILKIQCQEKEYSKIFRNNIIILKKSLKNLFFENFNISTNNVIGVKAPE
jgi:hypothetical protein